MSIVLPKFVLEKESGEEVQTLTGEGPVPENHATLQHQCKALCFPLTIILEEGAHSGLGR